MRSAKWHLGTPALSAVMLAFCGSCSDWPPAVTSGVEIGRLPSSQRQIRAIGVGDQELRLIAEKFQQLNYLYLKSNSRISDQGISYLTKSKSLHQLVIEDGSRITDAGIAVLAGLPNLRELMVTNAPLITDASLVALDRKKDLEILYLRQCAGISESGKSGLKQALTGCKISFDYPKP